MTLRIHIDRLVLDRGVLEPGQLAEFRAVLAAELARQLAPGQRSPDRPAAASRAARLGHQVADAVGKRLTSP